jgi:uncharacterized SAM-binding protein YcdF (DUF218 family)
MPGSFTSKPAPARILFIAGLGGVVLTAAIMLPIRGYSPLVARHACIANLKRIDGATATMFLEHHGPTSKVPEIPTDEDLFGAGKFIPNKLSCPAGGTYTYGWHVTNHLEKPRCSIPGHTI